MLLAPGRYTPSLRVTMLRYFSSAEYRKYCIEQVYRHQHLSLATLVDQRTCTPTNDDATLPT